MDNVVHFPPPGETAKRLRTIDATSFAGKDPPPREWHVDGLLPAKTVTILNGDGGVGKSLIALQLATSTVMGGYWLGRECKRGPCLFVTAEDDDDELHRRLSDITADQEIDMDDVGGLVLSSLAGEDAVLALPSKSGIITRTPLFAELEQTVADLQPVLVVLDTLADLFGGDENVRTQARQFISLLRGLALHHDTTVLLLAHPSLSGMASGSGTSGSTAWSNSVRSRLYLDRVRNDDGKEDDPNVRIVRAMKSNYGPTGDEVVVRWRKGVFTIKPGGDSLSYMAAEAKACRIFMELLDAYTIDNRPVSPMPSNSFAPAVFSQDPRSENIGRTNLTKAMNRLFNDNRISVVESGPPSKRRSRIVAVQPQMGI